jgi:ferritin-like metal-binding protein YciE
MGLFSSDIKTLDDLFVHTLQDIYYAESQITKALPKMIDKVSDPQLKSGFKTHLVETQNQVKRVEQVFEMHGETPKAVTCPAIDGIIEEAEDIMKDASDPEVLDAAALAAAQAVEHYEITRYGTLIAWARELGRNDCASVLQQNLDEEKAADEKLNEIAKSEVNREALMGMGEESDEEDMPRSARRGARRLVASGRGSRGNSSRATAQDRSRGGVRGNAGGRRRS